MAAHSDISPGRWAVGPLVAAVQRHSLTPIDINNSNTVTDILLGFCYFCVWVIPKIVNTHLLYSYIKIHIV
jgi:hypothetical protein